MSIDLPLCKYCGKEMFVYSEVVEKDGTETVVAKCLICSNCRSRGPEMEWDGKHQGFIVARAVQAYLRPFELYDEMVDLLGQVVGAAMDGNYSGLAEEAEIILERLDLSHARKYGLDK